MNPIDELDPRNFSNIDSMFTIEEINKVENIWGVKWEELGVIAKLSFGFTVRNHFNAEAIADRIVNGSEEEQL